MSILVSGSLAFDSISTFPGKFSEQILPTQLHILNVSFLIPTLRREFGGCAGNIAYGLAQLGARPIVAAAVGDDGHDYVARLKSLGVDASIVLVDPQSRTAQAFIITDQDNNQITAFHPGAMEQSHRIALPNHGADLTLGIVGPDGREAMITRARQLHDAKVPFVFDPGQGLPMFDGEALKHFISQATWIAVNDYEGKMLCDRVGLSLEALSKQPHIQGVVMTLGAQGCEVWQQGQCTTIAGIKVPAIVDPTGCGDAFRAGLLYGIDKGWTLARACALGNQLGAIKIGHRGGQSHTLDLGTLTLG